MNYGPEPVKRGRYYYYRTYDPETKRSSWANTRCTSKENAKRWRASREEERTLVRHGLVSATLGEEGGTLVGEAVEAWLSSIEGTVSKRHFEVVSYRARGIWMKALGGKKLRELSRADIEAYLKRRKRGTLPGVKLRPVADATVNDDLLALRRMFEFAADEGWLSRNPARRVKRLSGGNSRKRNYRLTPAEVRALLEATRAPEAVEVRCNRNVGGQTSGKGSAPAKQSWTQVHAPPAYLYPLVYTALHSGLRRGTLLGIEWCHVDLSGCRWKIPPTLMKKKQAYNAPIPEHVVEVLSAWKAESGGRGSGATVFGLGRDSSIRRSFQRAVRRAGLQGLTFHDLRRCYLNNLRDQGVPIDQAMELTAHANYTTVLKHYREVSHRELGKVVEGLRPMTDDELEAR